MDKVTKNINFFPDWATECPLIGSMHCVSECSVLFNHHFLSENLIGSNGLPRAFGTLCIQNEWSVQCAQQFYSLVTPKTACSERNNRVYSYNLLVRNTIIEESKSLLLDKTTEITSRFSETITGHPTISNRKWDAFDHLNYNITHFLASSETMMSGNFSLTARFIRFNYLQQGMEWVDFAFAKSNLNPNYLNTQLISQKL